MHFHEVLPAVATLFAGVAATLIPETPSRTQPLAKRTSYIPYFNTLATEAGLKWFGSAVDPLSSEWSDSTYMSIFNDSRNFGCTTPGNVMKWEYTEPTQGTFTFTNADELVAVAKATGKKVRCHNLVWSSELPSWVTDGDWTSTTLAAAMKTHITTLIEHFGDSCYSWDVVNEAINYDGSWTSNVFLDVIGENYVAIAFKYAYEAVQANDLSVKLFYNDYQIEWPGTTKTEAVINSILLGVQAWSSDYIQGVGMESHFSVSDYPTQTELESVMASYAALGLLVHVTELDVACTTVPCTAAMLTEQNSAYYNTVAACKAEDACEGVTVWDFDDKYSWIQPSTNDGEGDPCLFYSDFVPHPAATAVSYALQGSSCPNC